MHIYKDFILQLKSDVLLRASGIVRIVESLWNTVVLRYTILTVDFKSV